MHRRLKLTRVAPTLLAIFLVAGILFAYAYVARSGPTSTILSTNTITRTTVVTVSSVTTVANHTELITTVENLEEVGTCSVVGYFFPFSLSESASTVTVVSGNVTSLSEVTETLNLGNHTAQSFGAHTVLTRIYTNGTASYGTSSTTDVPNLSENNYYVVSDCTFQP
jgi:hypothetical protein